MAINWDEFDKDLDLNGLKEDVRDAEAGSGDFPEIPDGKYEVSVNNMELGESKKGDPMLKIRFEILDGDFKGQKIFYNGPMQVQKDHVKYQIHRNNEMLRKLWDASSSEVEFNGFNDYADLVLDIAEEIIEDGWEYVLEKRRAKNPEFDEYEILEVLD